MTDKKELAVTEGNKLIASKEERRLVETFMGYADGYLSKFIRWNDIMPIGAKITAINLPSNSDGMDLMRSVFYAASTFDIKILWQAVVEFIRWYNNQTI